MTDIDRWGLDRIAEDSTGNRLETRNVFGST